MKPPLAATSDLKSSPAKRVGSMGVAETFLEVLATHGSSKAAGESGEIVDYCVSTVEAEDFDHGTDGEETFEAIGPFLVGASMRG